MKITSDSEPLGNHLKSTQLIEMSSVKN